MRPPASSRATVLVADDHKVVAEGVAECLRPYFDIVGVVDSLELLVGTIVRTRPQVVVLDITFGTASSLPVIQQALESGHASARIVVLTAHDSSALEQASFNAGALAYLPKEVGTQELRLAIEAALQGRRFGFTKAHRPPGASLGRELVPIDGVLLRPRQIRVLLLMHGGFTRAQVAEEMGISKRGVDFHLAEARRQVGARKLHVLLRWVAEQRVAMEEALQGGGEEG
ncbi:MAG: response regulator [Gemmatimonadales bacterium]